MLALSSWVLPDYDWVWHTRINAAVTNCSMSSQVQRLIREIDLNDRSYRLTVETTGTVLQGKVVEDGNEVYTIHSTVEEDEAFVKQALLREVQNRCNRVFNKNSELGTWVTEQECPASSSPHA